MYVTIERPDTAVLAGPIPPLPKPLPTETPLCGGQTDTRRLILHLVRQEPGIRAGVLASRLGIHKNAVDHHLGHLERIGAIRVLPGPCRCPVAPEHRDVPLVVLCPHGRAVLDCLWRLGPSSLRRLAREVRISTTKAGALLRQLVEAGFVVDHATTRGRFAAVGARRIMASYEYSVWRQDSLLRAPLLPVARHQAVLRAPAVASPDTGSHRQQQYESKRGYGGRFDLAAGRMHAGSSAFWLRWLDIRQV